MNQQIVPSVPKPNELACFRGRDVPRFLVENYPGMQNDIVEFLQSYYYHNQNGDAESLQTSKQLSTADAEARLAALMQTGALEQAFEEAKVIQLHEANKTGWYANVTNIHSLAELIEVSLAKQIEKDPTGGTRYEYQRLLSVLNVIEGMAVKAATDQGDTSQETADKIATAVTGMIANPKARRKMRESAKVVDIILHSDADEDEKLQRAADVFKEVADPNMTYLEFVAHNKTRMFELGKEMVEPIPAKVYLLLGQEMIVIDSPGEEMTRSVESALRGLTTDFGFSDPASLLEKLTDSLYTKGKYANYKFEDGHLVDRAEGVRLPVPEHFQDLLAREVIAHQMYIKREAEWGEADVPILDLFRTAVGDPPLRAKLCEMFEVEDSETNSLLISQAFQELYPPPPILMELLPNLSFDLYVSTWERGRISINLSVQSKEVNIEGVSDGSEVQT